MLSPPIVQRDKRARDRKIVKGKREEKRMSAMGSGHDQGLATSSITGSPIA